MSEEIKVTDYIEFDSAFVEFMQEVARRIYEKRLELLEKVIDKYLPEHIDREDTEKIKYWMDKNNVYLELNKDKLKQMVIINGSVVAVLDVYPTYWIANNPNNNDSDTEFEVSLL